MVMANRKSNMPTQENAKLPVMSDKQIAKVRQSIIDMIKESRFADGAFVPTLTLYEMSEPKYEQMKQNGYVFAMFLEDCPWKTLKTEGFAYDILRLVKEGWLTLDNVVGYLPIPLSVQRWNYLIKKHGPEEMGGVTFAVGKLTFPLYQRELTNIIQKLANKPLLCCTAESSVESGIDNLSKVDDLVIVPFEFLITHVNSSPLAAAISAKPTADLQVSSTKPTSDLQQSAVDAVRNSEESPLQPLSVTNIKTQSIGQPPPSVATRVSNGQVPINGGSPQVKTPTLGGLYPGTTNVENKSVSNNLTPTSPKSLSNLFAVPVVKPTSSPVVTIQPALRPNSPNVLANGQPANLVPTQLTSTANVTSNPLSTNLAQLSKRSGLDGQTSPTAAPLPLAVVGSSLSGKPTSSVMPTLSVNSTSTNPRVASIGKSTVSQQHSTGPADVLSVTNANALAPTLQSRILTSNNDIAITTDHVSNDEHSTDGVGTTDGVGVTDRVGVTDIVGLADIKVPSLASGGDAVIRLEDVPKARPTTTDTADDSRILENLAEGIGKTDRVVGPESVKKVNFGDKVSGTDGIEFTGTIDTSENVASAPPGENSGQTETNDETVRTRTTRFKCGEETHSTPSDGYDIAKEEEESPQPVEISKALIPYRPLTFQNVARTNSSYQKNHKEDNDEESTKMSLLQTQMDDKLETDADWVIRQVEMDLQLLEIDPSDPLYDMLKSDQVRQWILENLPQPEGNSLGGERGTGKSRVHVQSVLLSDALDRLFSSTHQNNTF